MNLVRESDERPIPLRTSVAAAPDPAARLVDALTMHDAMLVVRADPGPSMEWLTEQRIDEAISQALMGPTTVEIWSPTDETRIVALRFPSDGDSPMRSLEVHTLSQFFSRTLAQEWTAETGQEPAFTVSGHAAFPPRQPPGEYRRAKLPVGNPG
jgi:hypothetical protein